MEGHLRRREENACSDFLSWFDDADRIRLLAARLINCAPEDIAFVSNAASALAILLCGLEWRPGDQVITLADEFPNNLYCRWLLARRGVEFVVVPFERLQETVTSKTRLVLLSSVNYATGFEVPLEELSCFLRRHGVLLYVDATQSLGALEFDVGRLQPAMMAVDAYKWLLGPSGAGFMYVRPDVRCRLAPTVIGWRSHKGWRQVEELHHGLPEFSEAAERFEGGMLNFPSLYAMGASIELMLEIGPRNIERRVRELAAMAAAVLACCGGSVSGREGGRPLSPVVTARFTSVEASRLAIELKRRRVLVSARHGSLRVSPHFYNDEVDLQRLETELRRLV